jgi:serine/threonine-protein kinase
MDRPATNDTILPFDGRHEAPRDLTGLTLGDFRVERLLGRGGMGEVYLGTQLSLNRPVALKVLLASFSANPTYLGRLKSEATAVAKLNHPNIVHIYMLGCVDDVHFIAMEYVEGINLRDYITKKGALELPLAFSVMKQTSQAIAAAGAVGLIHRDIKPENILLTRKGRVKVTDFGLCRDLATGAVHLTQSGITMGTPLYMSPEQAQGHEVDHRSDLYSLGVTFYHMLTGDPPFRGDTALAVALKQVREAPRSMLIHRPDLPQDLDRLVLKLIAKSPNDRYQSAIEMLADLAKLRESVPFGSAATVTETSQDLAQTEESPAPRGASGTARAKPSSLGARSTALDGFAGWGSLPLAGLARLSWPLVLALGVAFSLGGVVLGWTARRPALSAITADGRALAPGLWLEPRWKSIPQQASAQEQLRYALFQAAREDWGPAFMAVPGYFPQAHDQVSKAYTQLARVYYRRADLDALAALEAELSQWKDASGYDQELIHVVHVALKVRSATKMGKADFLEIAEGFRKLTRDDVPDMYDLALLELSLELCADATVAATQAEAEPALRQALHTFQTQIVRRLYRLELPKMNRAISRAALKKQ